MNYNKDKKELRKILRDSQKVKKWEENEKKLARLQKEKQNKT